eukprot:6214562-Pleurochrysis_carterae.AAC.1
MLHIVQIRFWSIISWTLPVPFATRFARSLHAARNRAKTAVVAPRRLHHTLRDVDGFRAHELRAALDAQAVATASHSFCEKNDCAEGSQRVQKHRPALGGSRGVGEDARLIAEPRFPLGHGCKSIGFRVSDASLIARDRPVPTLHIFHQLLASASQRR